MNSELLPIGSVVLIGNSKKKVMIVGVSLNGYEAIFYDYFEPSLIGTLKSKGINVETKELNSYSVFNNTI